MGRITASVTVNNARDLAKTIRCDALVDTGASYLILPTAWKERLGELETVPPNKARMFGFSPKDPEPMLKYSPKKRFTNAAKVDQIHGPAQPSRRFRRLAVRRAILMPEKYFLKWKEDETDNRKV